MFKIHTVTYHYRNKIIFPKDMKVLNDSGRQCCKENGVPIKCLGMCSGLKQIGSCEKHLDEIRNCQELTKGIIQISLNFCNVFLNYIVNRETSLTIPLSNTHFR